jgi:hypothetical protein
MRFGADGESALIGIERRTSRDGETFECSRNFQTQVIMAPASIMEMHDELTCCRGGWRSGGFSEGLGRPCGLSLVSVFV